jgi:hypothetical protein
MNGNSAILPFFISLVLLFFLFKFVNVSLDPFFYVVFIVLASLWILGTFFSLWGFIYSLMVLPLLFISIFSQLSNPNSSSLVTQYIVLSLMVLLISITWAVHLIEKDSVKRTRIKRLKKNSNNEIYEVIKELEYLKIP